MCETLTYEWSVWRSLSNDMGRVGHEEHVQDKTQAAEGHFLSSVGRQQEQHQCQKAQTCKMFTVISPQQEREITRLKSSEIIINVISFLKFSLSHKNRVYIH